jgi:hypothetical protein
LDLYLPAAEIASPNEINDDLVVHKKVFRMTQLLEKYKAYLPADTDTYSTAKIQDRLAKHSTREPVYHHFDSMRTPSTCSHAHRVHFYVL